jgi:hypothetical protein
MLITFKKNQNSLISVRKFNFWQLVGIFSWIGNNWAEKALIIEYLLQSVNMFVPP